jgi:1-acyl-sn-glycerol-3-phosphate acyltransferase
VPIVPVAIIGVRDVMPMHSHHVRPGKVTLRIGEPIPTEGLHSSARREVTQQIFESIQEMKALGR